MTPHWFGHGAGPVDFKEQYQSRLSSPRAVTSRCSIRRQRKGWQQVMAQQNAADLSPAELIHSRPRVGSRRERRFIGRANWVASSYKTA